MCTLGKAQKRPENTLSLHLRLMVGTETDYKHLKKKKKIPEAANTGERRDSDFQFSTTATKKSESIQRNKKVCPIQRGGGINRNCS